MTMTKKEKAKARTLFSVKYGSSLYGTTTPTSDVDWKVVYLPKFDALLRNDRVSNVKELPVGKADGEKMKANEEETEYIPLQVFLNDFFAGQTYAVELAFAMLAGESDVAHAESSYSLRVQWMVKDLTSRFLHSNLKGMLGYAVGQATKYGMKTQRFLQAQTLLKMVEKDFEPYNLENPDEVVEFESLRLRDRPELLAALLATGTCKYEAPSVENGNQEFIVLPNKKSFPYGVKWTYFVRNLKGTLQEYGHRVRTSLDGEDWKALMHALRISQQVLELHTSGKMNFPRANREELLSVRRGEVAKDEVLERFAAVMQQLEEPGVLPELTEELAEEFSDWKDATLRLFYLEEAQAFFGEPLN